MTLSIHLLKRFPKRKMPNLTEASSMQMNRTTEKGKINCFRKMI